MEAICSSETLVCTYKPTRRYNPEDRHDKDEVGGTCTTHEEYKKCLKNLVGKSEGRGNSDDPGVDGDNVKIDLKEMGLEDVG
jgi:hypothetical protein